MMACHIAWTLYRTPKKIARVRSADVHGARNAVRRERASRSTSGSAPSNWSPSTSRGSSATPARCRCWISPTAGCGWSACAHFRAGRSVGQALRTLREHIPHRRRAGRRHLPGGTAASSPRAPPSSRTATRCSSSPRARTSACVMNEMRARGSAGAADRDRRRRQHRFPARERARGEEPGEAHRARHAARAAGLGAARTRTIVLHGDAADEELLIEENIDSADVFAALTNSEEANILSAMLAKRLGAHKVMALINKPSYAELIESGSHRRRHLAADHHHRLAARARAPRRRRAGALAASRRGGGDRGDRARR